MTMKQTSQDAKNPQINRQADFEKKHVGMKNSFERQMHSLMHPMRNFAMKSKGIGEQARIELENRSKDLEFLTTSAKKFTELETKEDVCYYIASVVREMSGEKAIVSSSHYNPKDKTMTILGLAGHDGHSNKIADILMQQPLGMGVALSDIACSELLKNKIIRIRGIYELAQGKVPKAACAALEKMLGIKEILIIGVSRENRLYGNAGMRQFS